MRKRIIPVILTLCMVLSLLPATVFAADGDKVSTVKVETLVEPVYDEVGYFGSTSDNEDDELEYAAVKVGDKWGYIDQTGKMVIEPKYDIAGAFRRGIAIAAKEEVSTYGEGEYAYEGVDYNLYLVKTDGSEIAVQAWWGDPLSIYDPEEFDNTWGYYDGVVYLSGTPYRPDGTVIEPQNMSALQWNYEFTSMVGPCVDGVIPMTASSSLADIGSQAFFMDVNGNITRAFPWVNYDAGEKGIDRVYAPDESGLMVAVYGGYDDYWDWEGGVGAMRADGTWAVSPVYSNYRYFTNGKHFSQGLFAVSKDGGNKWGAVDTSGREAIPLQYDSISSFNDDLAAVELDGKWCYIDRYNNAYQIGTPEGGVASKILIASQFSDNIAAVYDGERAYCIVNTPVNGVLPAIQGTEDLALSVYFPDFEEYQQTGELGLIIGMDKYAAIERDGKWGFLKLTFELEGVNPFEDVHIGDYFYDPVQYAVENAIASGTSTTTFSPEAICTRAQILAFLWRANGSPEQSGASPFTDISTSDYYYQAALWAAEEGLVSGSTFDANTECTRAMTMEYMWKAAGSPEASSDAGFADVSADADYAQAVAWAVGEKITSGTGEGQFSPEMTCTRGQIMSFIYRAAEK